MLHLLLSFACSGGSILSVLLFLGRPADWLIFSSLTTTDERGAVGYNNNNSNQLRLL